jgi:single-strand DNA-binding protein
VSSINRITLIGSVVDHPDARVSSGGDAYVKFQIKVDRPDRNDGMPAQSDTIDVVSWRQVAESAKGIIAGDMVVIDGRIQTRTTDDEAGRKKYFTEVDAKSIQKVAGASLGGEVAVQAPTKQKEVAPQFKNLTSAVVETKSVKEVSESDFDFSAQLPSGSDEEVPF